MGTKTLITTPLGFASTAAEVIAGIDLTAAQAIVTGVSSGVGFQELRVVARASPAARRTRRPAANDRRAGPTRRFGSARWRRGPAACRLPAARRTIAWKLSGLDDGPGRHAAHVYVGDTSQGQ
jgi:hypothetical protein